MKITLNKNITNQTVDMIKKLIIYTLYLKDISQEITKKLKNQKTNNQNVISHEIDSFFQQYHFQHN